MRRLALYSSIIIVVLLAVGYMYVETRSPRSGGGGGGTSLQPGGASTTVINGTVFLEYRVKGLRKNVMLGGVLFKHIDVTTTGCWSNGYIAVFPDGSTEQLWFHAPCPNFASKTTSTTSRRYWDVWSKHSSPRVGIRMVDDSLIFLVSKGSAGWRILAFNVSEGWLAVALAPPNTSLSNPRILVEIINAGYTIEAESTRQYMGVITVTTPSGGRIVTRDPGLGPATIKGRWVETGYVHKQWIVLKGASKPGVYGVEVSVLCPTYMGETTVTLGFSLELR